MKLQQQKNKQYTITLPSDIIRFKGWKKGDTIDIKDDGKGNPILIKVNEKG